MRQRIRRGAWILKEKRPKIQKKQSSIDPKHYFYVKDGRIIKNLFELREVLTNIPEHTFNHHVNHERNDFSNWIKNVFNNEELALKLSECKTKEEMIDVFKLI